MIFVKQQSTAQEIYKNFNGKNFYSKRVSVTRFQQFKKSAACLAADFGRKSTIHCMNRIFQAQANIYERLFWFLTLAFALFGSVSVCIILSKRFNQGSVQTVVQSTNRPVYNISFPEVAICNINHLNWQRLEEAKQRFLPQENNTEKLRLFEQVIGLYDTLEFGEFEVFNALKDQRLELVQNINFTLVFDFMTWRCEEFLTECVWSYTKFDCCEIFSKSKNLNGLCWNFNTLSTPEGRQLQLKDDKYPWRTGTAGFKSGLSVRVLINEDKHYRQDNDKGLLVSVMEPKVFYKIPDIVPANTQSMIVVEPVIYLYDSSTKSLSSSTRRCLFSEELNDNDFKELANFTFMIENCETQCRQEYLLRYCNCTLDLLFPTAGYRPCKVKDLLCLAKNNSYLRFMKQAGEEKYVHNNSQGMICKCYRNCYSVNYLTDVKILWLATERRERKATFVDLNVYFRFPKMMVYRTSLVFGWVDLLVSFGGIAGLFLGCSLISVMELFYFGLIELPVFVIIKLKSKSQINNFEKAEHDRIPCKPGNWTINRPLKIAQNLQKYDFSWYEQNFN